MQVARVPLDDPAEKNGLIRYSLRPRGIGHRPEDAPIAAAIPPATGRFPYVHSNRAPVLRGNKDYVYERIVECGVDGIVNPAEVKDNYLVSQETQRRFNDQMMQVNSLDGILVDSSDQVTDGIFALDQQRQAMAVETDSPIGVMRQSVTTRCINRSQGRVAMSNRQSVRPSLEDTFDAILGRQGDILEGKDRPTFATQRQRMPTSGIHHLNHPQTFSREKQGLQSTMIRSHDPKDAPRGYSVNHQGMISNPGRTESLTFLGSGNYGPSLGQARTPDTVSRRKNIRPIPTSVI